MLLHIHNKVSLFEHECQPKLGAKALQTDGPIHMTNNQLTMLHNALLAFMWQHSPSHDKGKLPDFKPHWNRAGIIDKDGLLLLPGNPPREVWLDIKDVRCAYARVKEILERRAQVMQPKVTLRVGDASVHFYGACTPEAAKNLLTALVNLVEQNTSLKMGLSTNL